MELYEIATLLLLCSLLPFVFDALNAYFPRFFSRMPQKSANMILFSCIGVIIVFVLYIWVRCCLPYYMRSPGRAAFFLPLHFFLVILLSVNTVYNWMACHFKGPGIVPPSPPSPQAQGGPQKAHSHRSGDSDAQEADSFCKTCQRPKPPKSYHCSTCGGCVPYFDHHCPFVASCIGVNNQRHFIMFLLDMLLAGLYAQFMSFWPFYECYWTYVEPVPAAIQNRCAFVGRNSLIFVPTFFGTIPIILILGWQLFTCWTNVTTRDLIKSLRKENFLAFLRFLKEAMWEGKWDNIYHVFGDNLVTFFFFPWTAEMNRREKAMIKKSS